jgi:hypothetical protein
MEQILAPTIKFKPRSRIKPGEPVQRDTRIIEDNDKPVSNRCADILEGGVAEYIPDIAATPGAMKSIAGEPNQGELLREEDIKLVIRKREPDLPDEEVDLLANEMHIGLTAQAGGGLVDGEDLSENDEVMIPADNSQHPNGGDMPPSESSSTTAQSYANLKMVTRYEIEDSGTTDQTANPKRAGEKFMKVGRKFVNINDVNLDMISHINPFARGEEILSKHLTPERLSRVKDALTMPRNDVTEEEAVILLPRLKAFFEEKGHPPKLDANDPYEQRLAQVKQYVEAYAKKKRSTS